MSSTKEISRSFLPRDKKQWSVFLLCLTISTLLWTLLKFSEEKEEDVEVQIEFINYPGNQILVGKKIKSFPVKIKAQGFELLSQSFGFSEPTVKIDLTKVRVLKQGDINLYYWLPKLNGQAILSSFTAEIKSVAYPLDTVKMFFSEKIEKELVAKFNFKVKNLTEHYNIGNSLESPQFVKVIGAQSILKNLDTIFTEEVVFDRLESDLNADYPLKKVFGIDTLFTDSIEVFLGVESIERFKFEVPIEIRNKPDSLDVKLFPSEVKINFTCGMKEFVNYTPNSFKPYVDFKDFNPSFKKMTIKLDNPPQQVKDISIEPFNVEYLLRSKD